MILKSLAQANESLIDACVRLRARPDVAKVQHGFDVRGYESGPRVEAYIDVEFADGRSVAWSLDIAFPENDWVLESGVTTMSSDGREQVLDEFPARIATSPEELASELEAVVRLLTESAERFPG
jgi:hypothetical protein